MTTKEMDAITKLIRDQEKRLEDKIRFAVETEVSKLRDGYVLHTLKCCDAMDGFATWMASTSGARFSPDIPMHVRRMFFRTHPINHCPFCGAKL